MQAQGTGSRTRLEAASGDTVGTSLVAAVVETEELRR